MYLISHSQQPWGRALALLSVTLVVSLLTPDARSQRPEPTVHGVFAGDSMFTVLPPNTIPAIQNPEFLTGDAAAEQMAPDEPVLGISLGDEAKAYSLWHLDAHEIVNDIIGGVPIAATW